MIVDNQKKVRTWYAGVAKLLQWVKNTSQFGRLLTRLI
jgi:hypothetical protein